MSVNSTSEKDKLLIGAYKSSWGSSTIALSVVAALEVLMLIYSMIDTALFGQYILTYRTFYFCLLTVAAIYIVLNMFVRHDIDHRYKLLNVANPLCAAFFFAWSLGITYFDAMKYGSVDPTVFMTFALTVPLCFYLLPSVYATIAIIADVFIMYLIVTISGSVAPLINVSIYCIFQLVLGINLLQLKTRLTERILEEQKNAEIDILTGFPNRRSYEKDMKALSEEPLRDDLVYLSVDLNGLKNTNDSYGHEAGDKMIIGAAQCVDQCFGSKGTAYRIGGDEFVAVIYSSEDDVTRCFENFETSISSWSEENGLELAASHGFVCHAEYPDKGIYELARVADERMYRSKAQYYQGTDKNRRRYMAAEYDSADSRTVAS